MEYLCKSFVGSILELTLLREFLENKVETIAIYKLITDILREEIAQNIQIKKDWRHT